MTTSRRLADTFKWTETKVDRLKILVVDGLTCAEIGRELGTSRNSVIGKIHRIGLLTTFRGAKPALPREIKIKTHRETPGPKRYRRNFTPLAPKAATMAERIQARALDLAPTEAVDNKKRESDMHIPIEQRCTLLELNDTKCRWPIGEVGTPEFYFCGATPVDGSPYCGPHCRRAINPRYAAPSQSEPPKGRSALERMRAGR